MANDDDLRDQLRRAYDRGAEARDRSDLPAWKASERDGFLSQLRVHKHHRLLEIGAGVGRDSRFFQDAGCDVTCIDLSANMVSRCRDKGLHAYVMDAAHLSFNSGSFDAVYSFNSLLHLPKDELPAVLLEVRRVLVPGGLFYFGTYGGFDHEGIHEEDDHVPPRFFSFYDDDRLTRVAAKVFNVSEFRSFHVEGQDARFRFQVLLLRKSANRQHANEERASMQLKELVTTSNLGDIALIKSLLDSEDISYLAQGENFHLVQPLIEPVRFLVSAEDLDRARPLIDAMQLSFSPLTGMSGSDESNNEDS